MKIKLDRLEISMIIGVIIALFGLFFFDYIQQKECISNDIFRLHVLANSNEKADQELKLKVRDAVLAHSEELFLSAENSTKAKELTKENLAEFEQVAAEEVGKNGYNYPVSCEVKKVEYNTRTYGDVTVPAGVYNALQIKIGEAVGDNWWCVMYPPLCLESVTNSSEVLDEAFVDGAITKEELDIMKNPQNYEVKLYSVELWKKFCNWFDELTC